ncbi:MAG TPA: hypothetical protein VM513_18790 [Kofleriaceae bacterium]|nr:hypothetical protein [Kofleriaceae bacterium]
MRARPSLPLLLVILIACGLAGCGDNKVPIRDDGAPLSSEKAITSFTFEAAHNSALTSDVTATITGTTITATVPSGVDRSALVATFATTGESVTVGGTAQVSGVTPNNFTAPLNYTVTAADGSAIAYLVTVSEAPSNAKAITAFGFEDADNEGLTADVTATITGTTITATVPFGTDVTALVATFTTTGASVAVGATPQVSGTTANDFTSPVEYVVTAGDGSTQTYTVTVNIAANSAKAITAFSFESVHNAGLGADVVAVISGTSITATVPFGTDVTGLVATFSTTGASVAVNGTAQVSGTTANDFSTPVSYVVTAADASMQTYTVTVNIAANTAKDLTSFEFLTVKNPVLSVNVTATITGTEITAIVPFGTDISDLVATFATTGDSVAVAGTPQVNGVTANDFTSPVEYTVTAADGSTQLYTVTVINSFSSSKDIIAFSILGLDGIINGTSITLVVPNGTDLTALIPTITITGASVSPGSLVPNDFTTPATYVVRAADNTTKTYTVTVLTASQTAKDITRFTINGLDAIIATTSPTTGTIAINMPGGTDRTALSPVVTITGVSVTPASGQTVNFTNPVDYVVTAADGSTKTYTVTVGTVNGNGTKLIVAFSILGVEGQITNGAQSSTVMLTLPAGTDLSAQTPTIVINGSSLSPPSRVPQDFTQPVMYTVTSADGSIRVYTVTITLAP